MANVKKQQEQWSKWEKMSDNGKKKIDFSFVDDGHFLLKLLQ